MTQKKLAILSAFVMLSIVICTINGVAYGKTVVTIWTPHDFDVRYKDVDMLWKPFEDANPDIDIKWVRVPDWEQKFRIAAAAGQLPDIFAVDGINVAAYASRGLLAELDDIIPSDVREDYWEPALEEMTWRGKLYAVGLETNSHLLYYNPQILSKSALKPPQHWDELVQIGEKLTVDKNGDGRPDQFGVGIPLGRNEFVMWILSAFIWQNGGDILNPAQTKCVVNEPKAVEALEFLSDLVNKYKISPKAGQIQAGPEGAFVAGKLAMEYNGPFMFGVYWKNYPNFKWDVVPTPWPKDGKRVSGVGGWHFSMYKNTKHKEAAAKVMRYLTSEGFVKMLAQSYGIPVRKSVAMASKEMQTYPWSVAIDQMRHGKARPSHPEYPTITDAMQQAFDKAILGGVSAKAALDEAVRRIDPVLAKWK